MNRLALLAALVVAAPGTHAAPTVTLPPPPASLTVKQARFWNHATHAMGFKSIEIIDFNPAVLNTPSITFNIEGETYAMEGKSRRIEPFPLVEANGQKRMVGGVSWSGVSPQGFAIFTYLDTGDLSGIFTTRSGQTYEVSSNDGIYFLVLRLAQGVGEVPAPAAPASGARE